MKSIIHITAFAVALLASLPASAETASQTALTYAGKVAAVCPGQWETQNCLAAVSQSNLVLAANYMENLNNRNHEVESEHIKEHCAASTAATEGEYPAYAMQSAFTECANMISDINDKTGVAPDLSHYQILVGAVLCMSKDRRCGAVEQGLKSR